MANRSIYWDSCIYLDFLKGDHPLHAVMLALMQDWQEGKVPLITSALTIAEVLWVHCDDAAARSMIPKSREKDIRDLFNPELPAKLEIVELSRLTAESARDLVWRHGVKPKDAVHIASALEAKCEVFQTNDKRLWQFSEKVGGDPVLRIEEPSWQRQEAMGQLLDEAADAERKRPS